MLKFLLKFALILLLAFLPVLGFASPVSAHAGAPFIALNNEISVSYPLFSSSVHFRVPFATAPKSYLVGENINFTIDRGLIPLDQSFLTSETLSWDFGDGSTTKGVDVSHRYSKTGSFFVLLKVKDPTSGSEVELESILLNVVPSKEYKLPIAKIKVNGDLIQDPLKEPVVTKSNSTFELDATSSEGKIVSYIWDFGDGSSPNTNSKVSHTFQFEGDFIYSLFPVLRVEDENGFISDALIQISRDEEAAGSESTTSANSNQTQIGIIILVSGVSLILAALAISFYFYKKPKK